MKALINTDPIQAFSQLPGVWQDWIMFQNASPEVHYEAGFREVVLPEIENATHRLGSLYYVPESSEGAQDDHFTYEILPKSEDELRSEILSIAQGERENLITSEVRKTVEESFQAITDPAECLEKQAAFPCWEPNIEITSDHKYQAFDGLELKLYRAEQSHTSQEGWEPPVTPALFTRIAAADEVLAWKQPTGAQDAYQTGDKVTHNASTWASTHANNVWEPGVFGWTKNIV
jgi:hypothetical protein